MINCPFFSKRTGADADAAKGIADIRNGLEFQQFIVALLKINSCFPV